MTYKITNSCTGCTSCVKVCPVNAIYGEHHNLHEIDPLVCIECGACGRICPAATVQDGYGILCAMVKHSLWERPVIEQKRCTSCGVCLQVCPTSVLGWQEKTDHLVHLFPQLVDEKNCIGCSICASACPTSAIKMVVRKARSVS